jgi:hypothetical protein
METKQTNKLHKDQDFLNDIAAVFKKHPGMNKQYFISHSKWVEKFVSDKTELESKTGDCCCVWGVDDDGNTFCQESGDDCC